MRQSTPNERNRDADANAARPSAAWRVAPAAAWETALDDGARPRSCCPRDKRAAVESAGLVAVWFLSKWIVVRKESLSDEAQF